MLLLELFGAIKKKPVKSQQQLEDEEEARRQRINTLRTANKPNAGKVAQVNPVTLSPEEFLEWHGKELESQGEYDSVGPQKGDMIMSHKGPLVVVDPNGGGNMIATVHQGDKYGKVSWNKLSKPVKKGDKQYYIYG